MSAICPYKEPAGYVRLMSIGEGARWTQWMLNACGAKLAVDGIFGPLSVKALKAFQTAHGLEVDGVSGPLTKAAMKRVKEAKEKTVYTDTQKELLSMRDAMLDYIEKRVGDIYVYGAQGEIAGDAVIDWSARLFPQYTTPSRAAKMKDYVASHPCNPQGETLRAFDCSGLFWAAENLVELPLDAKRDVDDATAAGLYSTYCVPVSKNDLHPLDLVFNSNLTHVAVVGRNGRVYEAAGSDIGVVMNVNVNTRLLKSIYTGVLYRKADWTKFGRLKIFYDAGL